MHFKTNYQEKIQNYPKSLALHPCIQEKKETTAIKEKRIRRQNFYLARSEGPNCTFSLSSRRFFYIYNVPCTLFKEMIFSGSKGRTDLLPPFLPLLLLLLLLLVRRRRRRGHSEARAAPHAAAHGDDQADEERHHDVGHDQGVEGELVGELVAELGRLDVVVDGLVGSGL